MVCCLQGTEFYFVAVLDDDNTIFRCAFRLDENGWMCGVQVHCLNRILPCSGVIACKSNVAGAHADIHAFLLCNVVSLSIDGDGACAADIDDAKLTALTEILCAEFVAGGQL